MFVRASDTLLSINVSYRLQTVNVSFRLHCGNAGDRLHRSDMNYISRPKSRPLFFLRQASISRLSSSERHPQMLVALQPQGELLLAQMQH